MNSLAERVEREERRRIRRWATQNQVYNLSLAPNIWGWSWQDLYQTYQAFGKMLKEYQAIQQRVGVPKVMDIGFSDQENIFVNRFQEDVGRIDAQLTCLDEEIARRNQLIGVMG